VPVGETTNFISDDVDCSDGRAITQHRHRENASPLTGQGDFAGVLPVGQHILDLRDLACEDRPARGLVGLRRSWIHFPKDLDRLRRKIMVGDDMDQLAVKPVHSTNMGVAETHSVDDDRVEDGLEVKARVADDFEDFGAQTMRSRGSVTA